MAGLDLQSLLVILDLIIRSMPAVVEVLGGIDTEVFVLSELGPGGTHAALNSGHLVYKSICDDVNAKVFTIPHYFAKLLTASELAFDLVSNRLVTDSPAGSGDVFLQGRCESAVKAV